MRRVWTSFAAAVICIAGCALYAFALGFLAMAVLKPILPANVGLWAGRDGGVGDFGIIFGAIHTTPELLGWWVVPAALACAAICYGVAAVVMRGGGRLLLRR
jgi:hypothetical protein